MDAGTPSASCFRWPELLQDPAGVGVDDNGRPTGIDANEGDLRPSPALLPLSQ